jgi:hypothetical protein
MFSKLKFAPTLLLTMVFVAGLTACGGGGGGAGGSSGGGTSTATGQFLDTVTSGLSYSSGGASGVTNTKGEFTYTVGSTVTFSVGNVVVGTVSGQSVVTPVTLVAGGSAGHGTVLNIVRFLMMLDQDNNPDNGITISAAVRTAAMGWPTVNFASASFDSDVAAIVASVSAADIRVASLPNNATAQNHVTTTLRCAMGGGYRGSWSFSYSSGSEQGAWYAAIDPVLASFSGEIEISGSANAVFSGALTTEANNNLTSGYFGGVSYSGSVSPNGTFSIIFTDNSDPNDVGSGNVTGSRVSVGLPPGTVGTVYRGTMLRTGTPGFYAAYAIAIDGTSVSGSGINLSTNAGFTITGLLSGANLTGSTSLGDTFSAVLSTNQRTISGTHNNNAGTFNACRAF